MQTYPGMEGTLQNASVQLVSWFMASIIVTSLMLILTHILKGNSVETVSKQASSLGTTKKKVSRFLVSYIYILHNIQMYVYIFIYIYIYSHESITVTNGAYGRATSSVTV